MICGDGTLQLIRLDQNGKEAHRSRSKKFFDVDKDPVFDQVARTNSGWLLASHEGQVVQANTSSDRINLSKPWSMLNTADIEENWRPGGFQVMGLHRGTGVLYVLMHQGGVDTHYEAGEEVWLFDIEKEKRIGRLKLKVPAGAIQTTQESDPKVLTINADGDVDVFDGRLLRHLRTIKSPVDDPSYLQTLGRND
jgi:methylamine dehydrogenase heavy chain